MDDGDNRNAWTPRMVFWNTLSTVVGAMTGFVAVAVLIYLEFIR